MNNKVFVFDIDGVLCTNIMNPTEQDYKFSEQNPHMPRIVFKYDGDNYLHCFLPYLDVLFKYLVTRGRVVFFSSAAEERNVFLVKELLCMLLGKHHYDQLKKQGQFVIYSHQHLKYGNRKTGEGIQIKDLQQILLYNEHIDEAVLIEDQPSFAVSTQRPVILAMDMDIEFLYMQRETTIDFKMNGTYFLLGLFKYYFENVDYSILPLRKGIEKIYKDNMRDEYDACNRAYLPHKESAFTMKLIKLGQETTQTEKDLWAYQPINRRKFNICSCQ